MGNLHYSHFSLPVGGYSLLLKTLAESPLTAVTIIIVPGSEHSQCITHRGKKTDHGTPFRSQGVSRVRCVIIIIFMQNVTLGNCPDGWWLSCNETLDYLLSLRLQWALPSSCFGACILDTEDGVESGWLSTKPKAVPWLHASSWVFLRLTHS